MSRTLANILGLLLFGILCIFCVTRNAPRIVEELSRDSQTALAGAGYEWAAVSFDGRDLTLTGTAPSETDRANAEQVVRLVRGVHITPQSNQLTVADRVYGFGVRRDGDRIVLEGSVPDDQTRSEIISHSASLFGDGNVLDALTVDGPAPDEQWPVVAKEGVTLLSRLAEGEVRMANLDVSVIGTVKDAATRDEIGDVLVEQLPNGYTGSADISVAEITTLGAIECEVGLASLVVENPISFASGSARLTPESSPILNNVVAMAQRCSTTSFEVAGFTDSRGLRNDNLQLSQERAEAVVDYMIARGISAERLSPQGYGEASPVATNQTVAGRSRNRRIEFKLQR